MFLTGPKTFVGREDVLAHLQRLATCPANDREDVKRSSARILLYGSSGAVKTAVVRELARRLQTTHLHQFVFQSWTQRTLDNDIKCFLHTESSTQVEDFSSSPTKNLRTFLQRTKRTYFLIFENVNSSDPRLILHLLPQDKHCVLFTSASDHLWREHGLVPEQVTAVALHGLTMDESYLVVRDVFESVGQLHVLRDICNHPEQKKSLKAMLKGTFGVPLALRLVAYHICKAGGVDDVPITSVFSMRMEQDRFAAGRVHYRGFHHVVQHALTSLSCDPLSLQLWYVISITSWTSSPVWFLQEVWHHLGLSRIDVLGKIDLLTSLGLVEKQAELVLMQPLVKDYFLTSAPVVHPELRRRSVLAILQVICKETILYRKKKLSQAVEETSESRTLYGCGQRYFPDRWAMEMHCERAIIRLLHFAQQLNFDIQQVSLCLGCLKWCQQRRAREPSLGNYPRHVSPDFRRYEMAGMVMDCRENEMNCSSEESAEIAYQSLKAYWSFFPHEAKLRKILSDIDLYTSYLYSLDLNRLLCCGAEALLSTKSVFQVLEIFEKFGYTPDKLVQAFTNNGNEVFASSALCCSVALANNGRFVQAKRVFLQVLHIWLPRSKNCALGLQEEVLKTSMELCECNCLAGQRGDALELCNIAYFIGQVDNFSKSAPALLLNVCYQACKLLAEESMDCCSQDELWLQRLDHVAMSTLDFTDKASWLLHKAYVRLFLRPLLNKKVSQTVAWAAFKRLLQLRMKMRGRIRIGLKLGDIVAPLLFVTGSVEKVSDLDLNVIRALCRKLAVLVEEREVRMDHIASNMHSYESFCSSDKDNKLSDLFAAASVFFQNLVGCKPGTALVDDPFTKKGVQSRMSASAPDPLATREIIRILSEELRECGKDYMADALSSTFQIWPQTSMSQGLADYGNTFFPFNTGRFYTKNQDLHHSGQEPNGG